MLPDLLTVPEVAERLRCTPQHVYALMKRDLVSVKVGRNRLVSVEALADFIQRNTQQRAS
jgi:excisionase family DNA binding protein